MVGEEAKTEGGGREIYPGNKTNVELSAYFSISLKRIITSDSMVQVLILCR